jgi:hypothetical protein
MAAIPQIIDLLFWIIESSSKKSLSPLEKGERAAAP